MNIDPNATDRVVVVGSGFGVWQGGRHIASARWGDVVHVRAFSADAAAGGTHVTLTLRGGTDVVVAETLPGYRAFLKAAESSLPGMAAAATWMSVAGRPTDAGADVVLFERSRR